MEILADGATLVLRGDFDVRSTLEVRSAVYAHLEVHRDADVVVDLSEVSAVDVTALRLLAVATRQAVRDGHHLTLRGCGPAVRRMLHLSRLIRVVEVERQAAIA
ncbi:STAS domain-containing protein [Nocardioides solisilvae]|uniref:STAS domain-containing protein n=1 Tax=Nocardioides solisilvae TaxID=1542435 RepID=UPI000D743D0C|nr:STAS domain-containing protein [Nocardioides solisilvae]